ncbi:MAG: HYR domain-containing protein, partial [Bacteroidales bacterium]|nr:HYR domain-containing protein [Bacteroidales bacterium]
STTTYSLTVTDANGCTAMQNVTVEVSAPLDVMVNSSDLACHGGTTEATVVVNGGAEPYIYSWSNGTMGATATIGAGYYIVTVTDSNGCSAEYSFTVAEPDLLVLSLSADSLSSSNPTANITATVTGGNAPYSYQWNNGSTTSSIQVNEAGAYSVTVVDSHGCSATESVTINSEIDNESPCIGCDPNGIDPFDPTAGISCSTILNTHLSTDNEASTYTHNGSDWDITANDNTGIASITYSLSGATNTITGLNTTLNGQIFEIGSTTVTWTVVDLYGNFSDCSFTVTVTDNEPPVINAANFDRELTSSTCSFIVPDLTEEIRAVSSDNITANSDLVITQDLSAGYQITTTTMVTVTVRDQSGNETSTTVVLSIPNTPTIMVNSRDVVCQGEMAEATVAVTGGTAPYAYNWSDGTTGATANLMVGSYVVTVTDSNGCSAEYSLSVLESEMPVLLLNADATVLTCSTQMSNITATVSGGTAPYIYTWSNGLTTDSIMVSNAGLYSVTLTDANGCEAMQSIVITEDVNAPMLSIVNNSNTTTLGCVNTEINLVATGGAAYIWSNGVSTAENVITTVGTYSVTATGTNGCTAYETISITEVPGLTIAVNSNDIVCNGGTTEATVFVNGGTEPYVYNWNNGMTTSTANLGAGYYIVTVTDSNGCSAEYSFAVTEPEVFAASITSTSIQCYGESTGSATVTVTGGTAPYTYNWGAISTQESTVTGLAAGTYSVEITDANGCNVTQSVTIDQPAMLDVYVTPSTTTICSGSSANIAATAMGGNPSYMYLWNDGSTTSVIEVT